MTLSYGSRRLKDVSVIMAHAGGMGDRYNMAHPPEVDDLVDTVRCITEGVTIPMTRSI
jgi:hypothetical protein